MHVLAIGLRGNAYCFDRDNYVAPASEAFTLQITNSAFSREGQPLSGTVVVSRSSDPVRRRVPGRPWLWTGDHRRAIFAAPVVSAGETVTATVPALEAGDYALQLAEGCGHRGNAALTVRQLQSTEANC